MLGSVELFSLLGFPARVAGRALLAFRYVSSHGSSAPLINEYAVQRFGKDVKWRPWLMIDVKELEETEKLINFGTDAQVENWRVSKLSVCGMIAIIGALVASTGVTALQLPGLEDCHYVARGGFVMSLILALLSVFFSGLQQTSFGRQIETRDLRLWLSSGNYINTATRKTTMRSSAVAHMILEAPFEIVIMSIALFIVGLGTYLGSSWKSNLRLTTGDGGNRGILIAFVIPTVFILLMYGHMMGLKDRELSTCHDDRDRPEMSTELESKGEPPSSRDIEATARPAEFGHTIHVKAATITILPPELRDALHSAANAQRKCAEINLEIAKSFERLIEAQSR